MADPIAVIVRFKGDPDDLFERFERARQLWIEAQDGAYDPPAFYALCKADDGIVLVDGWETDAAPQGVRAQYGPAPCGGGPGRPRRSGAPVDLEARVGLGST